MSAKARHTPEEEHLAGQERMLDELTERLTAQEAEFSTTGSLFARFRAEYIRRLASLYAELDRVEAEIARRIATDQMTTSAWMEAAQADARAEESRKALGDGAEKAPDGATPTAPSLEVKALYRDAAKRIHPDLATDEVEKKRRHGLMAALNDAYAAGDAAAIERILDGESSRPEAIEGDDVGARLMRVIRRIAQVRRRIEELDDLTEALRSDPMFVLFEISLADWTAGLDPLAGDEAALRERIASARARLAALVLSASVRERGA
ncbi:MAG: hypothetical protein U0869_07730 [Chloroflexota bacterium]